MVAAIKQLATVQPDGKIEVTSYELRPGSRVEVIVLTTDNAPKRTLSSFIGSGKGCFSSVEEVDQFIRSERDAWDR
jgi:hypothetical protein